jgi:hypothetical protein
MTANDLERAVRALARQRPFRPFLIEFHSGDRLLVSHPEAVIRDGELFLHRGPDRSRRVFSGLGISQIIDPPTAAPAG